MAVFSHFFRYNVLHMFDIVPIQPKNLRVYLRVSGELANGDTLMSLTALAIKAAKPQKKVYKLSDAKGLHKRHR
jgi:hypothetical protein